MLELEVVRVQTEIMQEKLEHIRDATAERVHLPTLLRPKLLPFWDLTLCAGNHCRGAATGAGPRRASRGARSGDHQGQVRNRIGPFHSDGQACLTPCSPGSDVSLRAHDPEATHHLPMMQTIMMSHLRIAHHSQSNTARPTLLPKIQSTRPLKGPNPHHTRMCLLISAGRCDISSSLMPARSSVSTTSKTSVSQPSTTMTRCKAVFLSNSSLKHGQA